MKPKKDTEKPSKPGPEPERVKIKKNWEDAMADALRKPRPSGDWPDKTERKTD